MDKLIITCCVTGLPVTAREVADEVRAARDAGAAVVHVHEPLNADGSRRPGIEAWLEIASIIRQESDVIYQHGEGGRPYILWENSVPPAPPEERQQTFDLGVEKPEMISVQGTEVDFAWEQDRYMLATRAELENIMRRCLESGVKPEFEVWHVGAYWNIQWLIDKGLVKQPYWFTMFFGGKGGVWSSPTIDELLHRVKYALQPANWQVSIWCREKGVATIQQSLAMFAGAITLGGHIRVGTEDNTYLWEGIPAKSNAELVDRVVRLARELGREVATPDEARQIIGLPPTA